MSEKYLDKPGKEREIKDLYDLIRTQFGRGAKLINNVRKLSNLENLEISLKSVDVNKVLKDAINYIKKSRQLKDINIKIESSEKKIFTRANELLIDVFDNLLINAVNYNENPKKEVLIKISRESKNNIKYIKFEFIDNGIGISNKRKENIFQDRFNKEKGSKGMGFGLTLVKKIVESYKGKIWIEDRVEGDYTQGSNFVFLIPEAQK
jgi:signal transduction histidine kinase